MAGPEARGREKTNSRKHQIVAGPAGGDKWSLQVLANGHPWRIYRIWGFDMDPRKGDGERPAVTAIIATTIGQSARRQLNRLAAHAPRPERSTA